MTQISPPNIESGLSDGEILAGFLENGREDSFAQIVQRHGAMVMGVCRSVLGNSADAEDATQAVFLTLARRAASLRGRGTLAGWLHRVAWYVAARAAEAAAIRRRHEQNAAIGRSQMISDAPSVPPEQLHAALGKLPEKYRLALILHHLEGRTEEETASLLGCSLGTASARLSRGRRMLKDRLLARCVPISTVGIVAAMAKGTSAAAISPTLTANIAKSAVCVLSGNSTSAAVSASSMALSRGAADMLLWAKLKIAAIVAAVILIFVGAGVYGAGAYLAAGAGVNSPPKTMPSGASAADSAPPARFPSREIPGRTS
jgi:RNA polymerase sigma factor (sigma-70 family)